MAINKTKETVEKTQKVVAQVEARAKEKIKEVAHNVKKKAEEFVNNNPKLKSAIIKTEKAIKKTASVITQAKKDVEKDIKVAAENVKNKVIQFVEKGKEIAKKTTVTIKREAQETARVIDKTLKKAAKQLTEAGKRAEKFVQQKKEEVAQVVNKANQKLEQSVKNTIMSAEEKLRTVARDIKDALRKAVDVTTTNSVTVSGNKTIKEKETQITFNIGSAKLKVRFTSTAGGEIGIESTQRYPAIGKNASVHAVQYNNSAKINLDFEKGKINKSLEVGTNIDNIKFNQRMKGNKQGINITNGTKITLYKSENQKIEVVSGGTIKNNGNVDLNLITGTHSIEKGKVTFENSIGISIDKESADKMKTIMQGVWAAIPDDTKVKIGIVAGVAKGAVNTIKGVIDVVSHPKQVVDGVKYVVNHPKETLNSIKKSVTNTKNEFVKADAYRKGEMIGKALFEAGISVAGTKGLDKLAKTAGAASNLGKMKKVFDITTKVAKPAFGH